MFSGGHRNFYRRQKSIIKSINKDLDAQYSTNLRHGPWMKRTQSVAIKLNTSWKQKSIITTRDYAHLLINTKKMSFFNVKDVWRIYVHRKTTRINKKLYMED